MVEPGDRRGLRQPVTLEQGDSERLLDPRQHLDGQPGPARRGHLQAAGIKAVPVLDGEQGHVHRRHAEEGGHPIAIDDRQGLLPVELRQQRQARPAAHRRVQAAGLAEGVEQWQSAEQHVPGPGRHQRLERGADIAAQVGVAELGALGLTCGPGGVEDDRGVLCRPHGNPLRRLLLGEQLLEPTGSNHDHVDPGHTGGLGRLVGEHREDHRDPGRGVAPGERDLTRLEQRVDRDRDGAEPQDGVVGDREVHHVRHCQGDPITVLHPVGLQHRGEPGRGRVEIVVAEHRFALFDRRQARVGAGPICHPGSNIHGGRRRRRSHHPTVGRHPPRSRAVGQDECT